MTTRRDALPSDPAPHLVRISKPHDLVSAVPLLLGFHPQRSLVLIAMGGTSGRRLGLTVRADLPPPDDGAPTALAMSVVDSLLLDAPSAAAVIVIAPRGVGADPPGREQAGLVVAELERAGIAEHAMIWAEATTAGSRWACYHGCCEGMLPDPSGSELAAASVLGGQVVYADRAELQRVVEPADPERVRRREAQLSLALDAALAAVGSAADAGLPDAAVVDAAVADAAAGRLELDDDAVVRLALALMATEVRDGVVTHCLGPDAAAAEQLWAALTRETPDPEAAQPATLLAVSALLRGDGALANVALDRAERAWPGHRFARLLRAVADHGIHPSALRASLRPAQPDSRAHTRTRRGAGRGAR